ncbi:MAG: hypothetical protein HOE19_04865 [Candidatus Komeilibacteria bacterium]|jgi:hypothetical protein|nr:hypothetical protein [Candidatus Komeilibacteria bacterium]MBT4447226.1 hypothetical protein [Candidatus Komeilibacteria bacterium]
MTDEELRQIIKENKQILDDIDKRMHRIERKFVWNTIFGFIKTAFILAPIIIGAIYLTPILKDYVKIFNPIFKNLPATLQNLGQVSEQSNNNQGAVTGEAELMLESFCDPEARQLMIDQLCK